MYITEFMNNNDGNSYNGNQHTNNDCLCIERLVEVKSPSSDAMRLIVEELLKQLWIHTLNMVTKVERVCMTKGSPDHKKGQNIDK